MAHSPVAARLDNSKQTQTDGKGAADGDNNKPPIDHRKRLALFLDNPKTGRLSKVVISTNVFMIILSVLAFFMNTVPAYRGSLWLRVIEWMCTAFFTIEVALRTYIATLNFRRMCLLDPAYWVDVLCVVPVYVELGMIASEASIDVSVHPFLGFLQLMRLVRLIKLFRHWTDYHVIIMALQNSWRALLVPCFAMLMAIAGLGGALYVWEEFMYGPPDKDTDADERFRHGFDAMWCIFWIVSTMGYDGYLGADHPAGKIVIAIAIMCGLLFTTMPITIIGESFRAAWEKKELVEVQMKIQDILAQRGLTINELSQVFNELDSSGDGQLDWGEFKAALKMLQIKVPISKMRSLFALFDEDETGEIDYHEFCRLLFPDLDEIPGGDDVNGADGGVGAESDAPGEEDAIATADAESFHTNGSPHGERSAPSNGAIPPPRKAFVQNGGIPPPSKKCNAAPTSTKLGAALEGLQSLQAMSNSNGAGLGALGSLPPVFGGVPDCSSALLSPLGAPRPGGGLAALLASRAAAAAPPQQPADAAGNVASTLLLAPAPADAPPSAVD